MKVMRNISLFFVLLFVNSTIFAAPLDQTNTLELVSSAPDPMGSAGGNGTATAVLSFKAIGADLSMNRASGSPSQNTLNWSSIFPMEGIIRLEEQKLSLGRDLRFTGNGNFSSLGTIEGNNYFISLSPRTTNFPEAFVAGQALDLSGIQNVLSDFNVTVTANDWSFDGQFVAAVHSGAVSGDDTLRIYEYAFGMPSTLTLRAEDAAIAGDGDKASCVRVAQNMTFEGNRVIALGKAGATSPNLLLYQFAGFSPYTLTEGTVANQTAIDMGDAVYAVAWRPEGPWKFGGGGFGFPGSHLAVVYKSGASYLLDILKVSPDGRIEGVVDSKNKKTLPGAPTTNNLSWNMRGDHITLACGNKVVAYEVDNKGFLIEKGSAGAGSQVTCGGARVAAFHPHMPYILVGVNNNANAFKLFEMAPNGIQTTSVTITTTDAVNFNDLNFKEDGFEVAAATSSGLRVFNFNQRAIHEGGTLLSDKLNMDKTFDNHCARWNWDRIARERVRSGDNNLVVTELGGPGGGGKIGGSSAILKNVFLELNSSVTLNNNITISENCTIEGNGNELTLADGVRITINANKILTLRNVILKGIRGRAEQFKGVQKQRLESIEFLDNTATLKLYDSQIIPETNLLIDQGKIVLADEVSSIEAKGKTIEYGDAGSQFQDARTEFSGNVSNFQGSSFTASGETHLAGGMDMTRFDGGGHKVHFDDMSSWPSGSPVDLTNTATPIYASPSLIEVPDYITMPPDGRFVCYVNTNTGTGPVDKATVRVDNIVYGTQGANEIATPTKWTQTEIGASGKEDGNIFQALWRPRPPRPITGGGFKHQVVLLRNAVVANLTKAGFAENYGFSEVAINTSSFAPMQSTTAAMVVPVSGDAAGMKATAGTWDHHGDHFAIALSDGTNHVVRVYKVRDNGSIPTTPVASVTLTEAVAFKQLYWTHDFQKLVWAGATKIGVLEFNGRDSIQSVGTDVSLANAVLGPNPHMPLLVAGVGANLQVYNIGPSGTLTDMGMIIPLNQQTNGVTGNNVTTTNDVSWHNSGTIMCVSTNFGLKLLEFDPTQQQMKPMIQSGELGFRNIVMAEWLPDGKTIVRHSSANRNRLVAQVFSRKSEGSLSNATIGIKKDFTIVGDMKIEGDTTFDCEGNAFTISGDATITIAAGVVLTVKNASALKGLRGKANSAGEMVVKNLIFEAGATLVLDNTPLDPATSLHFTNGIIKIINGNFQVENNNAVSFASDGNVKVEVEAGRKMVGKGGTGRARLKVPAAAQSGDFEAIEQKMQEKFKEARAFFDESQFMLGEGEHQEFEFASIGALQQFVGGADANDRVSQPFTDGSLMEFKGDGTFEVQAGTFAEQDFQATAGNEDKTKMAIKEASTYSIAGDVSAKGTPHYEVTSGATQVVETTGTLSVGASDTDTSKLKVTDGGTFDAKGDVGLEQGTHTINITQGGAVDVAEGKTFGLNQKPDGTAPTGTSKVAGLTIEKATFNGCLAMNENTDGSKTAVKLKDADTKNMTTCFEDQLELSVEVTDYDKTVSLKEMYHEVTLDQDNKVQHKTATGTNAVDLGGTMTDIGPKEVVAVYKTDPVNGDVEVKAEEYVATAVANGITKAVLFDPISGEQSVLTA